MVWEHEPFARKKLFALTLSTERTPHYEPLTHSTVFDTAYV